MSEANVVTLLQPGSIADPLTEVSRNGARSLPAQAVEAEVPSSSPSTPISRLRLACVVWSAMGTCLNAR